MEVEVYRNLHRKQWSVRSKGRVRLHLRSVVLQNVKFVVQPGGRARVLKEQRKNVHAFVKGQILECHYLDLSNYVEVKYNPYISGTFILNDGTPIHQAKQVILTNDAKCFALL